jgi:hypothetical protein
MTRATDMSDGQAATPPRYGTDDDELARILADRRRLATKQRLWPGLVSGAIIAALVSLAFRVQPVRDAVATLTAEGSSPASANGRAGGERWEPSSPGATADATARYARVRAALQAAVESRSERARLAPLLEERVGELTITGRLAALEAWARVHAVWLQALDAEALPREAYAFTADARPDGPDPLDALLLRGPDLK